MGGFDHYIARMRVGRDRERKREKEWKGRDGERK
jgi:hypothetical protein